MSVRIANAGIFEPPGSNGDGSIGTHTCTSKLSVKYTYNVQLEIASLNKMLKNKRV